MAEVSRRKGNVIQMKQKQSVEGVLCNAKPSIKKVGTMLGTGAMAVLTIGTISVFGLTDRTEVSGKETKTATECKTSAVQTVDEERENPVTTALDATVSWWKAGVEEYDFAEKTAETTSAAKKATVTSQKKTTNVTTKKTEAETSAKVKAIANKPMYAAEAVNMRQGPSKDYSVVTVIDKGTKIVCTGKTNDGWCKVKFDGMEGYCMAEYLTAKQPAAVTEKTTASTTKKTSEVKTEASKKTTTSKTTTSKKTTTSQKTESAKPVISYTEEEFEMMCYVLQGEVGGCSDKSKIAVANVIINRVKSSRFENTIKGVLTSPNQFTAIYAYYNKTNPPSQNTMECARRALNGEGAEESKGATYYYAPRYCSGSTAAWFESLTFCMELEGQRFFKS